MIQASSVRAFIKAYLTFWAVALFGIAFFCAGLWVAVAMAISMLKAV